MKNKPVWSHFFVSLSALLILFLLFDCFNQRQNCRIDQNSVAMLCFQGDRSQWWTDIRHRIQLNVFSFFFFTDFAQLYLNKMFSVWQLKGGIHQWEWSPWKHDIHPSNSGSGMHPALCSLTLACPACLLANLLHNLLKLSVCFFFCMSFIENSLNASYKICFKQIELQVAQRSKTNQRRHFCRLVYRVLRK